MHSRLHIILSFVVLLACKFDSSGLGEATGPSSDGSGAMTTELPGTTSPTMSEASAASETLGTTTGGGSGSATGGSSTGVVDPSDSDPATTEPPASCGDGMVDPGEGCDDGTDNGPTHPCTPDCAVNICGDGYALTPGEDCDDGNTDESDACRNDCSIPPSCGNSKIDNGEACDDGNAVDTDGCIACKKAVCGDGHIQANVESCDTGQESATCNADCSVAACGDGKFNPSAAEVCDLGDKNGDYNSGCNANCSGPGKVCGDGVVDAPEEKCDIHVALANAACAAGCQMMVCMNGFGDCDNQLASGCEVNTNTDDNHCGKCQAKCGGFDDCDSGSCG